MNSFSDKNYKRKRYVTDPVFQFKLTGGFLVLAFIECLGSLIVFNYLAAKTFNEIPWNRQLSALSVSELITPLFMYVNFFNIALAFILLFIFGSMIKKKIRGPLFRLNLGIKRIRKGHCASAIKLRQSDDFQDIAAALDNMLGKLRNRFISYRKKREELSKALILLEVNHLIGSSINEDIHNILVLITELRKEIKGNY